MERLKIPSEPLDNGLIARSNFC